jgi:O-acetyl-ADP-ribose deacetylase (regulator of RNase III)
VIQVVLGALVESTGEALVCPIRSDLAPMSAAARDVIARAGPTVTERLQGLGQLPVGGAFLTPGGELEATFLIHVVTAAEDEPETPVSVKRSLRNGLRRAAEWGLTSVTLPPLGMGAGHMEPEDDARAMLDVLFDHLAEGQPPLEVTLIVENEYEREMFARLVEVLSRERLSPRD